jgi:tetratricopeptide (TPR) repeat protein
MKIIVFLLLTSFITVANINTSTSDKTASTNAALNAIRMKQSFTIGCAPDISDFDFEDPKNAVPLLEGWGKYRMPVTQANDSAYIYFQQGINMYYAFHIIEAMASFEKSVQFDKNFAMGYWGKALAFGPNINDDGYSASPEALVTLEKAQTLANTTTPEEQALIGAMSVRYTADTTQTREHLNQQYADAMKRAHQQFPESIDIAALYADALMIQHPWDLYDRYGQPKTWTPPIVTTLEKVLAKNANHPGAAHYYIHAVEASNHPEKALNASDVLPGLMPGVSHVVHMPAHIYIRTGNYAAGVTVDEQAVQGYKNYLSVFPAVEANTPLYLIHNLHMQATCANMDGTYAEAMKASIDTKNSFDTAWLSAPGFFGNFVQYVYMTPILTQIRFGKWTEILQAAAVPDNFVYANLLWHYARGLAYARQQDFTNAKKELDALKLGLNHEQLKAPAPNYANPSINGARVAEKILLGEIAKEQNKLPEAIALLTEAVELEDAMIYNEPKDWVHPARQYLGTVQLKAGKFAAAEKTFRQDLQIHPKNGWAYTGLAIALHKQGKPKLAEPFEKLARKAFERSDVKIIAAVF